MKNFIVALLLLLFSVPAVSKTLVIIGDSLTEGYGVSKEAAFPALLEKKIQAINPEWKIVNSGVSGSTSASAVSRVKWVLKSKPDMVMLALGANDGLRGVRVPTTEKNLDDALKLLTENTIPVILGGMYVPPNYGKKYQDDFKKMFLDLSKKHKVTFVPFILDKVAGKKHLNLSDGVHPNEEGYKIMAEEIFKQIKGLFSK